MVVNFFIQTLSSDPSFVPELCFWEPYSFMVEKTPDVANTSRKEKECIGYILKRLQSEFLFCKQIAAAHENQRDPSLENGIFRVSDTNYFSSQFNIVWQACYGCAFVMVLTKHENKAFAENVLSLIVKYATSIFDLSEQSSELRMDILLGYFIHHIDNDLILQGKSCFLSHIKTLRKIKNNPDRMTCLLSVFLPSGQLIVLNHRLIKMLQKDLEKLLADKT